MRRLYVRVNWIFVLDFTVLFLVEIGTKHQNPIVNQYVVLEDSSEFEQT